MNEQKKSLNILSGFQKQDDYKRADKISVSKSRIGFLNGFMLFNKLTQSNYVGIFYDVQSRRIAFTFFEGNKKSENHKLIKEKGEHYRYCKLNDCIKQHLNISNSDYKKYEYIKHLENGKEIYFIQLNMKYN